jgi:hypothetical protein
LRPRADFYANAHPGTSALRSPLRGRPGAFCARKFACATSLRASQ